MMRAPSVHSNDEGEAPWPLSVASVSQAGGDVSAADPDYLCVVDAKSFHSVLISLMRPPSRSRKSEMRPAAMDRVLACAIIVPESVISTEPRLWRPPSLLSGLQ